MDHPEIIRQNDKLYHLARSLWTIDRECQIIKNIYKKYFIAYLIYLEVSTTCASKCIRFNFYLFFYKIIYVILKHEFIIHKIVSYTSLSTIFSKKIHLGIILMTIISVTLVACAVHLHFMRISACNCLLH